MYRRGIDFYENYLQTPFPFSKLDVIYCNDFFYYGMENPGAITIDERRYL
jgi:aminopeptidase N